MRIAFAVVLTEQLPNEFVCSEIVAGKTVGGSTRLRFPRAKSEKKRGLWDYLQFTGRIFDMVKEEYKTEKVDY